MRVFWLFGTLWALRTAILSTYRYYCTYLHVPTWVVSTILFPSIFHKKDATTMTYPTRYACDYCRPAAQGMQSTSQRVLPGSRRRWNDGTASLRRPQEGFGTESPRRVAVVVVGLSSATHRRKHARRQAPAPLFTRYSQIPAVKKSSLKQLTRRRRPPPLLVEASFRKHSLR